MLRDFEAFSLPTEVRSRLALDREKTLQIAQKYVDKKKYDRAIAEYQKIVEQDPTDARTLLKIGDLQARIEAYADAIATYDKVGQFYASKGFSLKAIAVYKQIRELIQKHVPELADRYGHIVPKLAELYTQLGLTSDALATYDEVATRLQRAGRDTEAVEIFKKMVSLDPTNPLPHLRLAEACCRVQAMDEAMDSFWAAAELLLKLKRRDDALRVVERILHFRQDPRYARLAAELYLERNDQQDGLRALAKLQICFQANPKDLDTLQLLARAFTTIGQEPKAIEVQKEMAQIAREQGRQELYGQLVQHLLQVVPHDERVQALAAAEPSVPPPSSVTDADLDVEVIESSRPPAPHGEAPGTEQAFELRPSQAARASMDSAREIDFDDVEIIEADEMEPMSVPSAELAPPARPMMASAPDVVVIDEEIEAVEEVVDHDSVEARAHARKAITDAESFRGLRLYGKAIETLRIAVEIDPGSVPIREKLRDVLIDAGDQDGAIGEMIALAEIHLSQGDTLRAEACLYQALELEPEHPVALELLEGLGGFTETVQYEVEPAAQPVKYGEGDTVGSQTFTAPQAFEDAGYDPDEPLPSYDLEEVPAARAMAPSTPFGEVDDPFGGGAPMSAPLPSFPLRADDDLDEYLEGEADAYEAQSPGTINPVSPEFPPEPRAPSLPADHPGAPPADTGSAVEEALDEAEFFASRGLYEDAKVILSDQLARTPNHPLLLERMQELDQIIAESGQSGTRDRANLAGAEDTSDPVFDIAASLDALDELEDATGSAQPASPFTSSTDEIDVDQVFSKFKEGVRSQVAESDSSTHYDLGVAYKEMGLVADAVSEFELAARDPKLECMCFAMIGMIHLEHGDMEKAAEAYILGLGADQKTIDQEMSLYYDLGNVYEMKGSPQEALYYFQKIARRDPGYRDVSDRIEALSPAAPPQRSASRVINNDDEFDAAFDDLFSK